LRWCECSCGASFVPPAEASARSLAQAAECASGHAVTTKIARTNDRTDQVDYACLVTSRDLDRKPGASSVERSIMVVRSTHKVTRSTEGQTGECESGDIGNILWGGGKGHVGHRPDDDTPPVARHAVPELRARDPHLPGVRRRLQLQAFPDAGSRRLRRDPDQGWSSTFTERRSSIAR
jgi:hypothetical protein